MKGKFTGLEIPVKNKYAVIMAGGGGTRLWPLSRKEQPKHMLVLSGEETMFEKAIGRLKDSFEPDNIMIVTVSDQAKMLMKLAPRIPTENFIIEPEPKGTASVVGLAAISIEKHDPDAVMVVLTADHLIDNTELFLRVIDRGVKAAMDGGLYTVGLQPTYAATGYGYIEFGEIVSDSEELPIHRVIKFKEKPDQSSADEFFRSTTHLWNSGMFIWKVSQILTEIKTYMPALSHQLDDIKESWKFNKKQDNFQKIWSGIKPETIDYGIMEKAKNIYVIPVDGLGWNDVGSWLSLFDFVKTDGIGNIKLGNEVIWQDTTDSLVVQENPDKLVATIGLKDIIIVDTDKALLICTKEQVQMVREIVAQLRKSGRSEYL
jgi:mannose-1-phosphate guanylyltransferase